MKQRKLDTAQNVALLAVYGTHKTRWRRGRRPIKSFLKSTIRGETCTVPSKSSMFCSALVVIVNPQSSGVETATPVLISIIA
jgi:hypothetical protein